MEKQAAMDLINELGQNFKYGYINLTDKEWPSDGWKSDMFNGCAAYTILSLEGVNADLDKAYEIVTQIIWEEVQKGIH